MGNVLANSVFASRGGNSENDMVLDTTGLKQINISTSGSYITAGKTYIAVFGDAYEEKNSLNLLNDKGSIIARIGGGCVVAKFVAPSDAKEAKRENNTHITLYEI